MVTGPDGLEEMTVLLEVDELTALVERVLAANGFSPPNARVIAEVVVAAEHDGSRSHGLFRVPGYLADVANGWADGRATPLVADAAPGVIVVDAGNGYCQPAYRAARDLFIEKTRVQGIAALAIRNSHHLAVLWPEVEDLAENGLVALAFRNSRSHMIPHRGRRKLFGTNPMAFACPRPGGPPLVWDQAASFMARGDIMVAAKNGERVPLGAGVDREGNLTTDPQAILDGGAQLPFGGYKGSLIALMVEVIAAAATGSLLSLEDQSGDVPGAQSANAGELIIAIDPARTGGDGFLARIDRLVAGLRGNGEARVPGERRHVARRRAMAEGISVPADVHARLVELARRGAAVSGPVG